MRRSIALVAAALVGTANGEAITLSQDSWEKEVTQRVNGGGFAFVKFLAPW